MNCTEAASVIADSATSGGDRSATLEHLLGCESCRSLFVAGRLLARPAFRSAATVEGGGACPDPEQWLALLDGSRAAAERARLVDHAAACPACLEALLSLSRDWDAVEGIGAIEPPRQVLLEAGRIVATPETAPRSSGPWRWTFPLAAAAGFALVLVGGGLMLQDSRPTLPAAGDGPSHLRAAPAATVVPLGPEGEVRSVEFRWSAPEAAGSTPARYRLVVADLESGRTVLERVTTSTSHVPDSAEAGLLVPGRRYHWLVEVVGDGRPSEAKRFWLAP